MIRTKSVHEEIEPEKDGLRILAARFRGRGLPASRYDIWMANLGPTEELLREFMSGKIDWSEFGRRYRGEMAESEQIDARNRTIKNHGQKFTLRLIRLMGERGRVTLLCHCGAEEKHCHRHLLQKMIERA